MNNSYGKNLFLERRNFIKSMAAAGLLSSLSVEKLFAQSVAPLRFVFVPLAHGWGTGPGALGNISGSELAPVLPTQMKPFEQIREQCLFIDGLRGTWWGNPHDDSYTDILTASCLANAGRSARFDGPFPEPTGESIDNHLAKVSGKNALRFSAGFANWQAAYTPMSFDEKLVNLPFFTTAEKAYQAVFANAPTTPSVDPVVAQLFPYLSAETQKIIASVPEAEKQKLVGFLGSVNQLQGSMAGQVPTMGATAKVKSIPKLGQTLGQDIDSYFDMVRVAFTNDTHRVAVVSLGENNDEFPWTNQAGQMLKGHSVITGDFHANISHFNGKPTNNQIANRGYCAYNAQKVVDFVKTLQATIDIDGKPLIDNTILVLTGEIGHGEHDRSRKPHIVIGGGNRIRRGRWLSLPVVAGSQLMGRDKDGRVVNWGGGTASRYSHADLFVKLANLAGSNITRFGIDVLNTEPLNI